MLTTDPPPQSDQARHARPHVPGAGPTPTVWLLRGLAAAVLGLAVVSAFVGHAPPPAKAPTKAPAKTTAAGAVTPQPVTPTASASAPAPSSAPTPTASIYTLPASPTAPAPPTLTGYSILVNQPGATVTGKCSTGTAVQITAAKANVTLTGHCTSVLITADGVTLNVDQFDFGYISGTGNVIRYGSGNPTVSDYGTGTSVAKR